MRHAAHCQQSISYLSHVTQDHCTHTHIQYDSSTYICITEEMRLATYDMTLTLDLLHCPISRYIAVTTFQHSTRLMNFIPLCLVYTHIVYVSEQPSFCNC